MQRSKLRLDSAQWKLRRDASTILAGFLRSSIVFVTSMAPQVAYSVACEGSTIAAATKLTDFGIGSAETEKESINNKCAFNYGAGGSLSTGWDCVLCGLSGIALRQQELKSVFDSSYWQGFFGSSSPNDPAEIHDYCKGVDYTG